MEKYLYIPVRAGKELQTISFYLDEEKSKKVLELKIPVDQDAADVYTADFMAEIPVSEYKGKTMLAEGDFPEAMGRMIETSKRKEKPAGRHPQIHFTAASGWTNDPNGMVYKDGVYHLYFQYNPFDIRWENMSWGHAVSHDLLHWEQKDSVMVPDEDGTMFSGCGLRNDRGLLGLDKDALLFFYTAAGGSSSWSEGQEFVQKIAYSLDGGDTLAKIKEPCIDTIYYDNRDPKVFWHEESGAYVMVLWLRGNDFGIFRSQDLKNWEMTQEIRLEDGWECPDLLCLTSPQGTRKWFFWCAAGYYFPGEFDGYRFYPDGARRSAYLTEIPYAAQTFSGLPDGRVISVPWLRIKNDGRLFTGAYGIPTELSWLDRNGESILVQKPVRELFEQLQQVEEHETGREKGRLLYAADRPGTVLAVSVRLSAGYGNIFEWEINGSRLRYSPVSGMMQLDTQKYQAGIGFQNIWLIIDDRILDVVFEDGLRMGTFVLKEKDITFAMDERMAEYVQLYRLK